MDNEKSWLRDKWSVAGTTIEGFKDQIAMVKYYEDLYGVTIE